MQWWKKALFAVFTVALAFGLLELALWVIGVQPVLYDEDPYVGFSSQVPLFVEEDEVGNEPVRITAQNKRAFFNTQRFSRDKPAGTTRLFCVGGSTTFGRPYDDATSFCGWLREMLPVADPSRRWEVINAGGISYATYRVALLMEELARYEPDLFIVYSGHNEFLERRTYSRIIEMPAVARGLGALLSRTRTYAAMAHLIAAASGAGENDAAPERLPGEVDTILDNSVGPSAFRRDDAYREQVLAHYRFNLMRMAQIARSVGAKMLLVTPASNLGDCSPFKSEHRDDMTHRDRERFRSRFDRARRLLADGEDLDALTDLDAAAAIDDRYAELHYLRGRALARLGRHAEAKSAFERARDEDVCPLRALGTMTRIVREVADTLDLPLVDFAARVEQRSPDGIPGDNLFLDHVHPTIEGNRILAKAILEAMDDLGMAEPLPSWDEAAVAQRVESGIDERAQGRALSNLAQVFNWAGKFEESGKLAAKAVRMNPDDPAAQYLAGRWFDRQGNAEAATDHYERALRIDPRYVRAHNGLGLLLARQGKLDEAVASFDRAIRIEPDFAEAHHNRGVALEMQGQLDRAVESYRQVLRLKPDSAEAHHTLANALATQGKNREAIEGYRRALRLWPEFVEAQYHLGVVLARDGELEQAADALERTLVLDPGYEPARKSLAQVRAALSGDR